MIKGSNLDNISERLELALQKEGIPGAVAVVTDKKVFCITQLLDGKT
jgi:hypothetical protein